MKIISHLALSAVLILSLLTGCAVKDPKNPRFVVAKGKGVSVTRGDLTKAEESILSQRGINLDQLPPDHLVRIERQVAEQLALQELLLKNASGVPEKEVQSELDSKFKMAEQRFGGTEGFKAQLAKDNVTESKLRKDLSKQIRIELFLKGLVANTPSPSAQEVEKYYNDNKRLFEHPAAVRASHILVAVPPQASAAEKAARKKVAEAAYARVKKGKISRRWPRKFPKILVRQKMAEILATSPLTKWFPNLRRLPSELASIKSAPFLKLPLGIISLK